MLTIATLTLAVLIAVVALLAVLIVIVRAVRTLRDRRRVALAAGPRRALLAFVADGGEEGGDELVAIGRAAWRAAEPAAVALLGKVRGEAHQALVAVFERRGVGDQARQDLRSRSAVRRARAAEILGNLQRRDAVAGLTRLLDDRHGDVRVVAVRALGRIGDPAAAWRLIASLARPDPTPSLLVTQALAQLGRGAEAALQTALTHPQARVRVGALDALGLLGATGTVNRVAHVLHADDDLDVRVAAAGTLGRLGTRSAVPPLLEVLDAARPAPLRAAAARALGELGTATAVPPLATLLPDPHYRVANEAAHALRRLGAAGLQALRAAAAGTDSAAGHAREALALAAVSTGVAEPAAGDQLVAAAP